MKATALAVAAFSWLPAGFTHSHTAPPATPDAWADSWILLDPPPDQSRTPGSFESDRWPGATAMDLSTPESSAEDEISSELIEDADPVPHIVLVGCELALEGTFTPETWAREIWLGAPYPTFVDNNHVDKSGRWIDYEQIPRRPERPDAYAAYRYPVADAPVVSGYDLDKPDDEQRRGRMSAVGHGGVDLMAAMGTPITMVPLEHQLGDAEVLYVGPLYGETVVTRHVLREGGRDHDYLLIFGHLDRAAEGVRRGRRLHQGATVGFVGNSASPDLVHLHLEARRVRDRVDAWKLPADSLHAREFTVVTDPRNVLPLRAPRMHASRCVPKLGTEPRRYWLGDALTLSMDEATAETP
jgi:Peptidase family M23